MMLNDSQSSDSEVGNQASVNLRKYLLKVKPTTSKFIQQQLQVWLRMFCNQTFNLKEAPWSGQSDGLQCWYEHQYFEYFTQWKIKKIKIQRGTKLQLIKCISHINLKNLQILKIESQKINNIQVLSWIQCERLEQIDLMYNKITNLSVFKKINKKKLKSINIRMNFLNVQSNHNNISRMKVNTDKQLIMLGVGGIIESMKVESMIRLQEKSPKQNWIVNINLKNRVRYIYQDKLSMEDKRRRKEVFGQQWLVTDIYDLIQ